MLRRIISIENVGRFAGLTAESGNQGDFSKLNIIYAKNAEGKSTLCDIFRSLSKDDPAYVIGRKRFGSIEPSKVEILLNGSANSKAAYNPSGWTTVPEVEMPNILIYDERFVLENVLVGHQVDVGQKRSLFGLVIGARALALEERLNKASEAQSAATANRTLMEANTKALVPQGSSLEAWRILPLTERLDEQIALKEVELQRAKLTAQNTSAIKARGLLSILALPKVESDIIQVLGASIDGFAASAMDTVRAHLERHKDIDLEWVKRGFDATQNEECPYCAQSTQGTVLVGMYASLFNEKLRVLQQRLVELETSVRQMFGDLHRLTLKQAIEKHKTEAQWWKESGGLEISLASELDIAVIHERMTKLEESLLAALQRKRNNPNQAVQLNDTEFEAIHTWSAIAADVQPYLDSVVKSNGLIKEHQTNSAISSVPQLEAELSKLTATKTRHAIAAIDACQKLAAAEGLKVKADNEKTAANAALKAESLRVFKEYGIRINHYLQHFNVAFRIARTTVSFTGGQPSGEVVLELLGHEIKTTASEASDPSKPSLLNTLSSGDKSTLALAYFFSVLDNEPDKAGSIVVLDDPFHRQDSSRRIRTIDCISEVANLYGQTFVLSHDLDFARAVQRTHVHPVRTFVFLNQASSILKSSDLPALADPAFIKDYKSLQDFIDHPTSDDETCRSVVKCIRQALEGYLRIKYPNQFTNNEWLGDMIGKMRTAMPDSILSMGAGLVTDLTQVNNYSAPYYHGQQEGEAFDQVELTGFVQQTLNVIHR